MSPLAAKTKSLLPLKGGAGQCRAVATSHYGPGALLLKLLQVGADPRFSTAFD